MLNRDRGDSGTDAKRDPEADVAFPVVLRIFPAMG